MDERRRRIYDLELKRGEKNEEKEFIVDSRSVFMRRMCDGGDSGRKSGKSRKRNRVRNGGCDIRKTMTDKKESASV